MNVIDIKHIEDCFDGSFIKELLFDETVTPTFIEALGTHGKLQYFKDFARPFYKVVFRNDFYIKGVEGNTTARILLRHERDIEYITQLINES